MHQSEELSNVTSNWVLTYINFYVFEIIQSVKDQISKYKNKMNTTNLDKKEMRQAIKIGCLFIGALLNIIKHRASESI